VRLEIEPVAPATVRALRRDLLYPDAPGDGIDYPGDGAPGSVALAAFEGEARRLVGTATVLVEAPPRPLGGRVSPAWRLRGVATVPDRRNEGIGTRLVVAALEHVAAAGGGLVWCNARLAARAVYERLGFSADGEAFELPGVGPHLVMWRSVAPLGG
jgi:GNAT superfamily N-acetyltransferase